MRGPVLRAERVARSGLEPFRKDVLVGGPPPKKGALRLSFRPKKGPPIPAPRTSSCLPLWRYSTSISTMSIRLVWG